MFHQHVDELTVMNQDPDSHKPNLNLQKGPLTLLVLALAQITTLMVRHNALLCCQPL